MAWPIPGGAAEINVKGATANGSSTVCALGCQSAAFSVNNDAPLRLDGADDVLAQRVADEIQLDSTRFAIQARPAETALLRCVCGIDALIGAGARRIMLSDSARNGGDGPGPEFLERPRGRAPRRRGGGSRRTGGHGRGGRRSKRTSSTDTLAVSAKAATLSSSGAVVSDLSLQATDDNVVVRAARADMDVSAPALVHHRSYKRDPEWSPAARGTI